MCPSRSHPSRFQNLRSKRYPKGPDSFVGPKRPRSSPWDRGRLRPHPDVGCTVMRADDGTGRGMGGRQQGPDTRGHRRRPVQRSTVASRDGFEIAVQARSVDSCLDPGQRRDHAGGSASRLTAACRSRVGWMSHPSGESAGIRGAGTCPRSRAQSFETALLWPWMFTRVLYRQRPCPVAASQESRQAGG